MEQTAYGPYQVLEKLGEGGMGEVYKAVDSRLDRTVALKLLSSHAVGGTESQERFLREARAAAGLDHPNVCTVYEVGEQEGRPFLAMAFVDGPSVSDKIAERPLKLEEALDLAIQAAQGLKAAHDKGIVHRDVKSSNLMLNREGQLKVMDFGLAHFAGQSLLTQPGTVLGTAGYMAPEVAQGKPADHRSDIWSLGVVLYEMVAGRLPFRAENEQAALFAAITREHEPLTALRAGLPLELDRIAAKALAKDPDERFQYIDEMLVDLRALRRRLESGEVKLAAPPARISSRTIRFGAIAALLIVAVTAGGILWMILGRGDAPGTAEQLERLAVLPLRNLSGEPGQEHLVDGLTEALITDLSKIGSLRVTSQRSVLQYKDARKSAPEIARELGVNTVLEGSVLREGNRVRVTARLIDARADRNLWAETYEREMDSLLVLQGEIARAVAAGIKVKLSPQEERRLAEVRKVNLATYELYLKGMHSLHKSSMEDTVKGLEYLHQALELDPADPLTHAGLARGYLEQAHGSEAREDSLEKSRAAARTALKLDPSIAEAAATLGFIQGYMDWNWDEAFSTINHALDSNPSMPMAYYHRAWFSVLFGRMEDAIADHKAAQRVDPFNPLHTSWLGELYHIDGRPDLAIAEARKAIEMAPRFPPGHFVLSLAHQEQGRHNEAIAALSTACEKAPQWRWAVVPAYVKAGRIAEARQLLGELQKQKPSPWYAFWSIVSHSALGEYDEAFRWADFRPHHIWTPWLRVLSWGGMEGMRKDSRFPALLRRMNLPPPGQVAPGIGNLRAAAPGLEALPSWPVTRGAEAFGARSD